MNNFILQNLKKFDKLTTEQAKNIFAYTIEEVLRLESVIDSVDTGVLVCDETHRLLLTNKSAARLLMMDNLTLSMINEEVWEVVQNKEIAAFLENTLKSGCKIEGREFEFNTNGTLFALRLKVLPLVQEYRVAGSIIIAEDITEKKIREHEARRVESVEILATLTAGVAHEIKNPLAAISIQIQILKKALANAKKLYDAHNIEPYYSYEDLTRHLAIVNEEIGRLNTIVVDFLFAVRPMFMTFNRGRVNDVVLELVGLFEAELSEMKIKIAYNLKSGIPLIDFDKRFLKHALLNLMKNSIEAIKEAGLKKSKTNAGEKKEDGALTLETDYTDSDVLIKVKDNGCGISDANKEKIFAPYFTTKESGTGLGLVLVFRIIREHSGKIDVFSKEGKGTEFIISLPIPRKKIPLLTFQLQPPVRQSEHPT